LADDGKTVLSSDEGVPQAGDVGTPCLVVYVGQHLGRRHVLDRPETTLGRSAETTIQVDHESVSREHAQISVHLGTGRVRDLGSTNGTWVNDHRITDVELRDGDLVRVGQTVFKFLSGTNIESKYHDAIYRLSTTDGLTGAANKRTFLEILERELRRAHRYQRCLSLVIFDIDWFKRVNDTRGHLTGDHVLHELGRLVSDHVRSEDTFARYGGEEFALVMPETEREGAREACETLRTLVSGHRFVYDQIAVPITVSFGITTVDCREVAPDRNPPDAETVIAAADAKLYEAKTAGRNRVVA
jgi:diguanylate cyclase (GGDEF)-like protein